MQKILIGLVVILLTFFWILILVIKKPQNYMEKQDFLLLVFLMYVSVVMLVTFFRKQKVLDSTSEQKNECSKWKRCLRFVFTIYGFLGYPLYYTIVFADRFGGYRPVRFSDHWDIDLRENYILETSCLYLSNFLLTLAFFWVLFLGGNMYYLLTAAAVFLVSSLYLLPRFFEWVFKD